MEIKLISKTWGKIGSRCFKECKSKEVLAEIISLLLLKVLKRLGRLVQTMHRSLCKANQN